MAATPDKGVSHDGDMPLMAHLIELRTRLLRVIGVVLAVFLGLAPFANKLYTVLALPLIERMPQGTTMIATQVAAPFLVPFKFTMVLAVFVAMPYILHQVWRFIAPGLYRSEKSAFLPFLISSPLLFLVGAIFAHYVVTPLAMGFFLGFADASSIVSAILPTLSDAPVTEPRAPSEGISIVFQGKVNETLDISLKMIIAFGLCFQLPVLLTLMGKAGLVSAKGLGGVRKYAIVLILGVAALVTPPDVVTQLILFGAVYPLYEISIFLVRRIEKAREARLRAEGLWVEEDEDEEAAK